MLFYICLYVYIPICICIYACNNEDDTTVKI